MLGRSGGFGWRAATLLVPALARAQPAVAASSLTSLVPAAPSAMLRFASPSSSMMTLRTSFAPCALTALKLQPNVSARLPSVVASRFFSSAADNKSGGASASAASPPKEEEEISYDWQLVYSAPSSTKWYFRGVFVFFQAQLIVTELIREAMLQHSVADFGSTTIEVMAGASFFITLMFMFFALRQSRSTVLEILYSPTSPCVRVAHSTIFGNPRYMEIRRECFLGPPAGTDNKDVLTLRSKRYFPLFIEAEKRVTMVLDKSGKVIDPYTLSRILGYNTEVLMLVHPLGGSRPKPTSTPPPPPPPQQHQQQQQQQSKQN